MVASPDSPLETGAWILVTGGAGFIGSHVVDALLNRGYQVAVVDDLSTGSRSNLPDGVVFVESDLLGPDVDHLFHDHPIGAVVHCAAQVKVTRSMEEPLHDLRVNVTGAWRILQLSKDVRRFVFLSTGGAMYGDLEEAATEETPPRPLSYYALHKYTAERYVEWSGLPYGILRFSNIYGPRQRSDLEGGVVAVFQERLKARQPVEVFGSGEQARDFLYVRDAVRAITAALESSHNGLWNIGVGYPTTVNDLLGVMGGIVAPPIEVRYSPPRPGEIYRAWLSYAKAKQDLGWQPHYTLDSGMEETSTWQGR